ncbi:MAG: glycine cleavage T C-terminal barrel domain-containing protein [Hasllibacter sp.]
MNKVPFRVFPTARLRASPFLSSAVADGAEFASVYNRMILPASFGDPEGEYWRLMNGVSMWDVGVERQIAVTGPDAARLTQILSPRDLSTHAIGQGKYVPICDHDGVLLNDPICLKIEEDRYWFSISDGDLALWAKAIAAERGLDVRIYEATAAPMAVQGPKAVDVVADLFGDWVRSIRYFWFQRAELGDIPVFVARSGWSKQGGFELYLLDPDRGEELWHRVREAGRPYGIGPGGPTTPERTESGLVSVGGDTDALTNPFEVRLGKFVDLDVPDDVVGIQALRRIKAEGVRRHQLGLVLDGDAPDPLGLSWERIVKDGERVGDMTNCVWSYRFGANIGYALISTALRPGDRVEVLREGGPVAAELRELPFA